MFLPFFLRIFKGTLKFLEVWIKFPKVVGDPTKELIGTYQESLVEIGKKLRVILDRFSHIIRSKKGGIYPPKTKHSIICTFTTYPNLQGVG